MKIVNGENLVALSNLEEKPNNNAEKKIFNKIGTASSIAAVLFVGTTMLKNPTSGEIISGYNYTEPSYIQYINLPQEKELYNLDNSAIDLMKVKNLDKLNKMAQFDENWNGTGAKAFSPNAIFLFRTIIEKLDKQPEIAPTGRNSLLMQYELDDKSLLAFEVSENKTEKVYIPRGDYSKAEVEMLTENMVQKIKESVEDFYGLR